MSEDKEFQIVFCGVVTGEYDLVTTKKRFQKLFRLAESRLDRLFSGKEFVIKSNVSEEVAMKFAIRIADAGCECDIETMPDDNDLSLAEDFVEMRKNQRRVRFRRGPRPGAIVPDRRFLIGRRRADLEEKQLAS